MNLYKSSNLNSNYMFWLYKREILMILFKKKKKKEKEKKEEEECYLLWKFEQ